MSQSALRERLREVWRVVDERQRQGGWTHPVSIVAVTKGHDAATVRDARAVGLRLIGENRVQEALAKQDACGDLDLAWQLIGPLQRNKVRQVTGRFALIHAVDRLEIAEELDRRAAPDASQAVLIQVNCSGEPQKHGVAPDGLAPLLDALRALRQIRVRGLMTMAPQTDDEGVQRRAFAMLRDLRDAMQFRHGHELPELSMGMSGDFGPAVAEGATLIRLGTILFGARTP